MASTRSRRGVLLDGPAPPRLRLAPSARANSWEDVADLAATLGIPLDEWQEQALEVAMGERTDGRWASKFVGVSAPRQNGKSQLIVARALAGVLLFGERLIIVSAHETDTAREVWRRLVDVVEDNPTLEARVTARMNAVNRESLTFGEGLNRQIVKLKARGATGSRGFSADCLLLDEAQILGKHAWGSIVPTMSARPNPQMWLFGTPPTERDDPFGFHRVRESALAKKARHCWLEWSADATDDIDAPETWAKANPSLGVRLSYEACADDRAAMDAEQFRLERLGIWPDDATPSLMPSWASRGVADLTMPDGLTIGLAGSIDGLYGSIGAAGMLGDKVAVGAVERREGQQWLVAEALRIQTERGSDVVIDKRGPVAHLIPDLENAGVRLVTFETGDLTNASESFWQAVEEDGDLVHGRHKELDAAVRAAQWRAIGDRRAFGRKTGDVSMLEAVALAAHHAQHARYDVLASVF